ncbi:uncharacterized protein LOC124794643 [Schistocerca piceifrons]|uniref:uncharacterized protein LOC124794643 n=1 Tax=Schistocerca piceifrons TaxID=274613 RepID=UPI001F5F9CA0|nr:uncharacterized protein LOC124794643 [Schistocerca piceifrons]
MAVLQFALERAHPAHHAKCIAGIVSHVFTYHQYLGVNSWYLLNIMMQNRFDMQRPWQLPGLRDLHRPAIELEFRVECVAVIGVDIAVNKILRKRCDLKKKRLLFQYKTINN